MNRDWEDELLDVGALRQASAVSAVRPVTAAAAGAPSSRPGILLPVQSTCRPLVSRYSQPQPLLPQSPQCSSQQPIPSLLQIPIANQTQQQQQPQAQPVNAIDRFTHPLALISLISSISGALVGQPFNAIAVARGAAILLNCSTAGTADEFLYFDKENEILFTLD